MLAAIASSFASFSDDEKKAQIKKVFYSCLPPVYTLTLHQANAIFELRLKNSAGKEAVWTIDLKKTGTVYKGAAKPKADVTIIMDGMHLVEALRAHYRRVA